MKIDHAKYIAHSLGIRLIEAVLSHKKRDKTLPKEFYRNYYNTRSNELNELVNADLMSKFSPDYYRVTQKGIEEFTTFFNNLVKYEPRDRRDEAYLRHRINSYCELCRYRFGDNNSDHIISAYENYTLKGFYTSHTTSGVIGRFKNELKQNFKRKMKLKPSGV